MNICNECSAAISTLTPNQRSYLRQSGRVYCSKACSTEARRRVSSATMARTNRKYASARMIARNPMRRPSVREKVSATLRRIGHKPCVQGGNGRPIPKPQRRLARFLSRHSPIIEYIQPTGSRWDGFPTHYKIDIALERKKVAIEVDGYSHEASTRKAQDRKKEKFLRGLGWHVMRFTNERALGDTAACVKEVEAALRAR